ncbi:MAG: transcriptional regulator [Planctomycetaceae bacterium]
MNEKTELPEAQDELPRELIDLGKHIAALPDPEFRQLEAPYSQLVDCVRRRRRILSLVQEALSQLRLDVKYLMFDLEVTRKERDELRVALEEAQRDEFDSF